MIQIIIELACFIASAVFFFRGFYRAAKELRYESMLFFAYCSLPPY